MVISLVQDLFIILTAGLILGVIAKRLGFSMLVGYLLAGALIGRGGIGLVAGNTAEIEHIAEVGVLLLLFSIGIEFSLEELLRLSRHFFVGGSIQMLLVAAPVAAICSLMYVPWPTALLIASATALSSTVLVFRALSEWGETASPQGRRAIGILLFQDAALVPLMLLMPLLAGEQEGPLSVAYLLLGLNSVLFVAGVLVLRRVFARWLVPMLGNLRSVELVILFGLIVLVGFCLTAVAAGLPPALGALAAGLALSGNRLTGQIDALILPYRESFGVVFFVSLGTLLDPSVLMEGPLLLILGFVVVLLIKTAAASVALLAAGLPWRAAAGMGMGLAQMGELTFVLISVGLHAGLISENEYNRMLFVAIGTLFVTPQLLKVGLQYSRHAALAALHETDTRRDQLPSAPQAAIVIGIGPIGRQAASQLEIMGVDVCLVDQSPVNLHAHAQQGFRTVAGDARDAEVLERAEAAQARLAIISVPDDRAAAQIAKILQASYPECTVIVRCRYQANAQALKQSGVSAVISEESEASVALLRLLKQMNSH